MAKDFNTTGNLAMANVCDYVIRVNSLSERELLRVVDRQVVRGRNGTTIITLENPRTSTQEILDLKFSDVSNIRKALKTDLMAFWNA